MSACVRVRACVCARACVRACVRVRVCVCVLDLLKLNEAGDSASVCETRTPL